MSMTTTNGTRSRTRKPAAKQPDQAPPAEPQLVTEPPPIKETALPGNGGRVETFRVRFNIGDAVYSVVPLRDVDPEVVQIAFRVTHLAVTGNAYDAGLRPDNTPFCECLGWLQYQPRPCRHLRALHAARMLSLPPEYLPATSANGHAQAKQPEVPVLPDAKPETGS
jgi:hypothetical protein